MIEGWIVIYGLDDDVLVQPTLYKTKEEANIGLAGMNMKFANSRFKFVCEPIFIKQEKVNG